LLVLSASFLPVVRSSALFRLSLRPPPSSTLFPYTTLFRSRGRGRASHAASEGRRGTGGEGRFRRGERRLEVGQGDGERSELADQDRKSTRLNSSHVKISYAVFCLKKKKKECRDRTDRYKYV